MVPYRIVSGVYIDAQEEDHEFQVSSRGGNRGLKTIPQAALPGETDPILLLVLSWRVEWS